MAVRIDPFTDEQARTLINLQQQYQVWIEAEQVLHALPYNLVRKTVKGRNYLYEVIDRQNNAKSLGPWDKEAAQRFNDYHKAKAEAQERRDQSREQIKVTGRLYRALRLPMIDSAAGEILREADRRRLLGKQVIVVGTNAMPAYSIEAAGFIRDVPDETLDFDIAWYADDFVDGQPVWDMLKAVDPTFTVNTEREFQARNAKAYEVELLAAPSKMKTIGRTDRPSPVELPEQEWLLNGQTIDQVVLGRDGNPARIVAPDPRWFALHKIWMSKKPRRNPLKKPKDLIQGRALLDAVAQAMPHFPLDAEFEKALPSELTPHFKEWKASHISEG
ncbi:MAG: hypothetical protein H0W74_13340 [Sphingosinicella sp.]|nr:hypothetical protein [Sphingosinicella sp.]